MVMFQGGIQDFYEKNTDLATLTRKIPKTSFLYDNVSPNNEETDWKLFWTKYYRKCPELSILALCLLSIGISEAACERSFSVQKLTHNDIRNRLSVDIVEAEMRVRFNKTLAGKIIGAMSSSNININENEDAMVTENSMEMSDDEDVNSIHDRDEVQEIKMSDSDEDAD